MKRTLFCLLNIVGWLVLPLFITACGTTSTGSQRGTSVVVFQLSNLASAMPRPNGFLTKLPYTISVVRSEDNAKLKFYIQNDAGWLYAKLPPGHYLVSSITIDGGTWQHKLPTRLLFEIPETDKLYYLGNAAFSAKKIEITRDDAAGLQFIKTLAGMKIPTGTERVVIFLPGGKDASQRDLCSFDFINKYNLTNEDE